MSHTCFYSPSATDSSFSVSTCDSPSLSIPATPTPSRMSRSLFNTVEKCGFSDKDWVSDVIDSWSSASSQELLWNNHGPAASDSDEMPRLTRDTSPALHNGISQLAHDRLAEDVSSPESRDQNIPYRQVFRERGAYNHYHGIANSSRWRSVTQPSTQADEGCAHATQTNAMAFNLGVNISPPSQDNDHIKSSGHTNCDTKRPSEQAGRACRTSMSRVQTIEDSVSSGSTKTADSSVTGSPIRKAKCSVPVGDKSPCSFLYGHFRLVNQDGTPCYSFSVQDSTEVFFARACRTEGGFSEDNCNDGFHYAFHSRIGKKAKGGWNCRFQKQKLASSTLIAKMEVSADGECIDSKGGIVETHFVLYTERCQHSAAEQKANEDGSVVQLSKAILRGHKSRKNTVIQKSRVYVELLAVAITMSTKLKHKDHARKVECGPYVDRISRKGWGLEFLKNSSKNGIRISAPNQQEKVCLTDLSNDVRHTHLGKLPLIRDVLESPNEGLQSHQYSVCNNKHEDLKMAVDVVVLLPAGSHGLSSDEDGNCSGPTPLLESWRLDGSCDCGGWDMGCGMSVLRGETLRLHKRSTVALTNRDRINWIIPGRPFVISSQDYKRRKLLVIDIIEAGYFSLSFQAQFSPLQAFATAVAIFHQQMTVL